MRRRSSVLGKVLLAVQLIAATLLSPIVAQAGATVSTVAFKDASRSVDVSIGCVVEPSSGIRKCEGNDATRVPSFDGVPLDLNVYLPPEPASGPDGNFPLVIQIHGFSRYKDGLETRDYAPQYGPTARDWAQRGYAVLQPTMRGFGRSCGAVDSRTATGCSRGWVRMADTRYEVRDNQDLAGMLVDTGLVDPKRIGATGDSYGGGMSMALATLRNRVMDVDAGNAYRPWKSPRGTPIALAAAAPQIPWSDLAYAFVPNGRTLDTKTVSQTDDLEPSGVLKQSIVTGLYAIAQPYGFFSPPGVEPKADLTRWVAALNAGEPYDGNPEIDTVKSEISKFHSSYYIDPGVQPAPTYISSGWTDDVFPVGEALRWQRRFKALYPNLITASMFFDFGHQRGTNRLPDLARLRENVADFFDRYVKGTGTETLPGVEALLQSCPNADKTKASPGPYTAASYDALSPGELRYVPPAAESSKTLLSTGGDPRVSAAVDPIAGANACATTSSEDQPGTATWRLPAITGSAKTLLGSPVMGFDLAVTGVFPTLIGRLWDVDLATGQQTLVARGIFRPDSDGKNEVFQLNGNGWRFEPGHQPKLELLGQDAPYARKSNGQFQITVSNLDLRLPVAEAPGARPGGSRPTPNDGSLVQSPAPVLVPGAARPLPKPTARFRYAPSVIARTTPKHDRSSPFRYTTTGRVVRPLGASGRGSCAGRVRVRVRSRKRTRSVRTVRLRSDCRFRSVLRIRARSFRHARLRVSVRFPGNSVLRPRTARPEYVRAG